MQQPSIASPDDGRPANDVSAADLTDLRRLMVQIVSGIAELQRRLDDPVVRSSETGMVLPGAIRAAPSKSLREAFEPVFESSFQDSCRKHPREIADAIFPIIGTAIRKAVSNAIRDSVESLNYTVEKVVSLRAIRWRIEARFRGRPFSEIVLARSWQYSVEQVFLIDRRSGVLLMHIFAQAAVVKDADMVSGMLTAIQDFVSDSFAEVGHELETIDVGDYKCLIQYGPKVLLVGVVRGAVPSELKGFFRSKLDEIHNILSVQLDAFKQENFSIFEPARPLLESCLLGKKPASKRTPFPLWLVLAGVVALLVAVIFVQVRNQQRWDTLIDSLQREPGIVVTRAEKRGSGGFIAGLRDPLSNDPRAISQAFDMNRPEVSYRWEEYHSPRLASLRDYLQIQERIIRFELGSARLSLSQADAIDSLATELRRLFENRRTLMVTIIGHTDGTSSVEAKNGLSMDRAMSVSQALAAQGVPPIYLRTLGVGNSRPLRAGTTEWDRAMNRSVSFRLAEWDGN